MRKQTTATTTTQAGRQTDRQTDRVRKTETQRYIKREKEGQVERVS